MFKTTSQSGSISMITVIFFSLIITIVTLSFVRLSLTEQRQSTDDDLSSRAFYAAESGVEDAKRALNDYKNNVLTEAQLNGGVCLPAENVTLDGDDNVPLAPELDVYYTCQLINTTPGDFQATLQPWEGVTIPLTPVSGEVLSQVLIEWHMVGPEGDGPITARGNGDTTTLPVGLWGNNAAMLKAMVFSHPSGLANRNLFEYSAGFINPATTAANVSVAGLNSTMSNGGCDASSVDGEYACEFRITAFDGSRSNYLRLTALYRATSVKVTLINTAGDEVLIDDVQAIVDVTGRANDVFRRIEARIALQPEAFPLPDYAIWSNEEICKDFSVTDDILDFDPGSCMWSQ